MNRTLSLAAGFLALALAAPHLSADAPREKGKEKPKTTAQLMRRKLELSQDLLAALTLNDLKKASLHANGLLALRKDPAWKGRKGETYESFSAEFGRTLDGIVKASKADNLESAKLHYLGLTLTCFNCHSYVRDNKDDI